MNRAFIFLVFCAMMHSGAAFKSDYTEVNEIFDSTSFNVAMFAMGWAVTNWIKGGSAQPPLWIKHWSKLLLSTPSLALRRHEAAIVSLASSPRPIGSEMQEEKLPEEELPPREVAEDLPAAALLPLEGEDSTPLVAALGAWASARVEESRRSARQCDGGLKTPPWRRHMSHSFEDARELSSLEIKDFLAHIYWHFECSSPCLVLALIYLQRAAARDSSFELTSSNCRRLLLTAFVMALKFHDDDYAPYPIGFYAEMGGVSTEDMKLMEKRFCRFLDWNFYVSSDEYTRCHQMLSSKA